MVSDSPPREGIVPSKIEFRISSHLNPQSPDGFASSVYHGVQAFVGSFLHLVFGFQIWREHNSDIRAKKYCKQSVVEQSKRCGESYKATRLVEQA